MVCSVRLGLFLVTLTYSLHENMTKMYNKNDIADILVFALIFTIRYKDRKRAKIRNRYNQAPKLTQDTNRKVKSHDIDCIQVHY